MHELMTKTTEEKIARAIFDKEKKFDFHFTDLVIFNEWNTKNSYTISSRRFKILAQESMQEFNPQGINPLFNENYFYQPFQKSSRGVRRDQTNPGGLLYHRYIILRQLLKKYGLLLDAELEPGGNFFSGS